MKIKGYVRQETEVELGYRELGWALQELWGKECGKKLGEIYDHYIKDGKICVESESGDHVFDDPRIIAIYCAAETLKNSTNETTLGEMPTHYVDTDEDINE